MSTSFEIAGKLIVKNDVQKISDKFKKREFVIEVENERNSDWNDFIKFQLTQGRCDAIEDYSLGSDIKVSFNVRGRKFEKDGKVNYFSNLEAWKVEKTVIDNQPTQAEPVHEEMPPVSEEDDLPF